jgi:ribokinase
MSQGRNGVTILGIFVVDLAFRAGRLPAMGETILGSGFALGPGGKGSNQAVAAARARSGGMPVSFVTRIGRDAFGAIGLKTWQADGVDVAQVVQSDEEATGAAFIFVSTETGNNAIIVTSGAAGSLSASDVEAAREAITASAVFMTQLEQSVEAAHRGLALAREAGVATIFNPAPAIPVDEALWPLCDYVTPNETEAATLSGLPAVANPEDARRAGDWLLEKGAGTALITLGERGALFHRRTESVLVPSFPIGAVVDTTGAGDAFNGAFATALAEGFAPVEAVRFACAAAGLSVTRPGTAPAMPARSEIDALLRAHP